MWDRFQVTLAQQRPLLPLSHDLEWDAWARTPPKTKLHFILGSLRGPAAQAEAVGSKSTPPHLRHRRLSAKS